MHHRAGQRAVGAGLDQHRQVGLLHGAVHVDVDGRDLGAALFARAHGVRHHVDLGIDRVGAPDDHQIGLRHLARIDAGDAPDAGGKTGIGRIDADRGMEAGIFLGVAQPVDAVAHDQAHGAGIVIGPHAFGAVTLLGLRGISRRPDRARHPTIFGANSPEPFGARAAQRMQQPVGVMLALGVTGDLGADDAGRVIVVLGAMHAADGALVDQLDVERAGRRAIVRTGGIADPLRRPGSGRSVHGRLKSAGRHASSSERVMPTPPNIAGPATTIARTQNTAQPNRCVCRRKMPKNRRRPSDRPAKCRRQPSRAMRRPPQTRTGNRSSNGEDDSALPAITIGMLTARPSASKT